MLGFVSSLLGWLFVFLSNVLLSGYFFCPRPAVQKGVETYCCRSVSQQEPWLAVLWFIGSYGGHREAFTVKLSHLIWVHKNMMFLQHLKEYRLAAQRHQPSTYRHVGEGMRTGWRFLWREKGGPVAFQIDADTQKMDEDEAYYRRKQNGLDLAMS